MMRIQRAEVDWHTAYDSSPNIKLLFDEVPDHRTIPHKKRLREKNGSALYYGELNGMVNFYAYNAGDKSGYGGQTFALKMEDGTTEEIKGPWSSRAGAMNQYFGPCVDVTYTTELDVWNRGHTFYGGHVTLDVALEAAKIGGFWVAMFKDGKEKGGYGGDITYVPVLRSSLPKGVLKARRPLKATWKFIYPQFAIDEADAMMDTLAHFGYDPTLQCVVPS